MRSRRSAKLLVSSVDEIVSLLEGGDYVCDRALATTLFLALRLQRPLLLEGEPGVGKTELARVVATSLGRRLIRLQCYEGLDAASAVYEWNYPRQMMEIRLAESKDGDRATLEQDIFSERFLIKRPLLEALSGGPGELAPVLLIDELDRTDDPFEAFLLEILSEFQISIPELGTIRASEPPIVIVTSNRTREIHDALKRRCLYHWLDAPDAEREVEILVRKAPAANAELRRQIVGFVQRLRHRDLFKPPGVSESIDWATAIVALDQLALTDENIHATLGVVLKYQDDLRKVRGAAAAEILADVFADAPGR